MEPPKGDSHEIEININETKFIFIFGLIYDDYLLMNLRTIYCFSYDLI